MTELLTAAQMRAIEAAAIASGEVTGLELMERAGRGVVEAIFEEWPELRATSHRAVVLCGPGNNGGDGFVVARLLKEWGWEVEVFLYGDPEKLPPDARANYERWRGIGEVRQIDDKTKRSFIWMLHDEDHPNVWIDALFGTGLSRPISIELAEWLRSIEVSFNELVYEQPGKVVAVDLPTGIDGDSGRLLFEPPPLERAHVFTKNAPPEWRLTRGPSFKPLRCDLTVSFHSPKFGHFMAHSPLFCRKVVVKGLGLRPVGWTPQGAAVVGGLEMSHLGWRRLRLDKDNIQHETPHKYTHGHALILSGPPGKGGAARLAARGALRIGAGLVTVGCPPEALAEHAARLDAVMLRPVADADAFGRVLEDGRINALCLGPGLGTGEREVALVAAALGASAQVPPPPSPPHEGEGGRAASGGAPEDQALSLPLVGREDGRGARRPLVLDADALTILAREPHLFAALHEGCVLTPHAGEFARLFPDIDAKLAEPATKGPAYSKVDATRAAAARAGCTVLYKGPDTVIADPSGRCSINSAHYDRAAPWLATAGSGDVLAGFIAGLLARGFAPVQAAETAAWLHVECARKFGPGLIAEDLPEQLPAVFRDLGL